MCGFCFIASRFSFLNPRPVLYNLSKIISSFLISEVINKCCSHIRIAGKYHIVQTGDLSLEVLADEDKIDQVIVNLVNNAVKYAPASPEIFIHIEKLENIVKISVIDKGPGISSANLSKLFDRYFRVNHNGNHSSGLGLGFYISSEIIRRHKGEIGVESELGKGSKFWFTIPLLEQSTANLSSYSIEN